MECVGRRVTMVDDEQCKAGRQRTARTTLVDEIKTVSTGTLIGRSCVPCCAYSRGVTVRRTGLYFKVVCTNTLLEASFKRHCPIRMV